jgi:hypothetical protein
MREDKELIIAKLNVIAAKAKALALEFEKARLWEGELREGVGELYGEITTLSELTAYDKR